MRIKLPILLLIVAGGLKGNTQTLPDLKSALDFVLFSSVGLVNNTGNSQYTGNIGSNTGATSGFGNFDGQMHNGDSMSQQCADDLNSAITDISNLSCDSSFLTLFSSNVTFQKGVYCVLLGSTLGGNIILDAGNDSNAVFIFNITGALSIAANTHFILSNGAKACRIFLQAGGLISIGDNSSVAGNIIGSGTIVINSGARIEGRVFATAGAITVNGATARIPLGCGLLPHTGPGTPNLKYANCYALFTSIGALTNTGSTGVTGKIGTDSGTVNGFVPANISQGISVEDLSTEQCKMSIDSVSVYLSALDYDIDILFPALMGNGLTLTPHVYRLNSNTVLNDTLFLNAEGNSNSVFVLKINGSLISAANSVIVLQNGAKSCNVFWTTSTSTTLNQNSLFMGSMVGNGNVTLNNGVRMDGRMLTRSGDVTSNTLQATIPLGCGGCPYSPVNNKPHALNDSIKMIEDGSAINIAVQANDNDPDGDPLSTGIVNQAIHGTSSLNGNLINYFPDADFNGRDTVLYFVCDNRTPSFCDTALLFIDVLPVNDTPDAVNDFAITPRNTKVDINVLLNDTDRDGDLLTITLLTPPDSGIANVSGNLISYTPANNFLGYDTLYYNLCDNGTPVLCDSARVVIRVVLNNPPVASNDTLNTCQDFIGKIIPVLANDSDPDGDSLTVSLLTLPRHGTAGTNGRTVSYSPNPSYVGNDTLTYGVCDDDSISLCDSAIVIIRVNPIPSAVTGPSVEIQSGEQVVIGADPVPGNSYLWSPSNGLNSAVISKPTASPLTTTTYILTETIISTGCQDSNSIIITVTGEGFYNGLSPNGDGKNDFWKIPVLNRYPENSVVIINRFGAEVWRANSYDNQNVKFTGKNMNGDDLPDGTYFYVITYNNLDQQGWLIIKR